MLFYDDKGEIVVANILGHHTQMKHIHVQYLFMRDSVENERVNLRTRLQSLSQEIGINK